MIQALVFLGTCATAIKGVDFSLTVCERATGIPLATGARAMVDDAFRQTREVIVEGGDMLVEGFGDAIAGILDPAHLFTDDPAAQRDAAQAQNRRDKNVKKQLRAQASQQQDTISQQQQALSDQQAALAAAQAKADAAEADAARARNDAAKAKSMQKAKVGKGFIGLSRTLQQRSTAAASAGQNDLALQLAQQALAMAQAAQKPPVDARDVLRGGDDAETRQLKTDTINALNRDGGDADFETLADRLTRAETREDSSSAARDLMDSIDAAGHDHHGACSCKGTCDACGGLNWKSPEIAGPEHFEPGDGLTWGTSSEQSKNLLGDHAPIFDDDAISRALAVPKCATGSCAVPRRSASR